jgi:hypothetical protein
VERAGAALVVGTSIHCRNGLRSLMDLEVSDTAMAAVVDWTGASVVTSPPVVLCGVTTYTWTQQACVREMCPQSC